MTRKPAESRHSLRARNPARLLALSAAISLALLGGAAHADPNPFARRGVDPAAQAARSAQQQGLQSVRAQQMAQRSLAAFGQAAQVRAALDTAQVAARLAAASSAAANQVPNGLGEGGLKVAAGVKFEPGAISAEDPRLGQSKLWLGAKGPTQNVDAGTTTVTIEQTQKKAILSWETFNVGKQTTVYFDQRGGNLAGGGNDWIALNRIDDPSGRPSQIFGRIKAEGSVYLLNRNGVLFGGTSQVNTRSLLASSLNLFNNDIARSNRTFISGGIGRGNAADFVLTSDAAAYSGGARPAMAGDIRIEAGAQIKTGAGGYALIAAPNIDNAGSVQAEDGQVQLAAVIGAQYGDPKLAAENKVALEFGLIGAALGREAPDEIGYGRLTNTGIVASKRGDVTLTGYDIAQDGYLGTTTGVSRPGTLSILALEYARSSDDEAFTQSRGGRLRFGAASATTILPEHDGETTTSAKSADQAFQPPSARLAAAQMFFQENSLVLMPGAKLDVFGLDAAVFVDTGARSASRILIDRGATINVAGIADVQRPMSDNIVKIPRIGENELADSPLLRGGGLYRQSTAIDVRNKGVTADGRAWVGTPLLNAAGYADQVPRGIDQMLIDGGSINIQGRELIARSGSTLDLSGGYVHYLGGMIAAPRLLGADGRIYRQADADPNMAYVGFAGDYLLDHQRWGVKELFISPMTAADSYFDPDYVHGGDGGQLNVTLTPDANLAQIDAGLVLAGDIHADAESGRYQIKNGESAHGGALKIATGDGFEFTRWRLQSAPVADVPDGFDMSSRFADLAAAAKDAFGLRTTVLSSDRLDAAGFSSITLSDGWGRIEVAADAHVKVEDGGGIALNGRQVRVDGTLEAVSGKIDLEAQSRPIPQRPQERGDIVLGAQARLLARGAWVNDGAAFDDGRTGAAHIDGGAISLRTHEQLIGSGDAIVDASGSILIDPNARLDVSGGGRIAPNGQLAQKDGVALGRGGDISLRTYVGAGTEIQNTFPPAYYDDAGGAGRLRFSRDSLVARNLGGGGTLRLDAREIRIGGDAPGDPRGLHLGADFFADGDFGAYDLRAELDGSIAAGSDVRVSQRSFLADAGALRQLASGGDLYAGGFGAFGRLDDLHRPAADFSLAAGGSVGTASPSLPLGQLRDELRVEQGARLSVDAGGDVRLGSRGQVTVLGDISARGGSITLSGDTTSDGLSRPLGEIAQEYWSRDKSVWLGADSTLDVSGIALIDPTLKPRADGSVPRDGKLLDGGKITLSNDGGYVVVEQGAQLTLDGAADRFEVRDGAAAPGRDPLRPTAVWSHAGSLTIGAAAGLFFDGDISAHGGAAQARGGVLELVALGDNQRPLGDGSFSVLNASEFVIDAGGSHRAAAARPGDAIEPDRAAPSGQLRFGAEHLQDSGVDTLQIGRPGGIAYVPIVFEGNVDLHLDRALVMNASGYSVRPAPLPAGADADAAVAQAKLSAQYVAFNGLRGIGRGAVPLADPARPGENRLDVNAGFIDFAGQVRLDGIKVANFDSAGDIRFYTPAEFRTFVPQGATLPADLPGQLLSGGDLNFRAAQLYPGTGERFIIRALGASDGAGGRDATRISIAGNGAAVAAPLSAGGALLLDATAIEQGGVLRAPGGQILLGVADPDNADSRAAFGNLNLTATQRVELKPGSLTSVSLDGRVVPYGVTVDGLQWQASNTQTDLAAPPRKQITLDASSMSLADGAVIDLSGGGDLQAVEWVPGTGGSRDVLSRYNTSYADGTPRQVPLYPNEREVYAIVPGAQPMVAPNDPNFGSVAVGKQVRISGVPGLPDGVYTLLPGRYATLPGAFRVVQRSGARDSQSGPAVIAPDGTAVVAGYLVDALSGARDALASSFEVQSHDTWSRYSQYAATSADKFFADRAQRAGAVAPQRPRDGGQLVLNAGQTLDLGASLKAAAAPGGAAAQVDIAAKAIQILGAGHAAREGYVQLDADKLNRLGAGSLLIGGQRRDRADGVAVDVRADSVLLDNDAGSALKAPEITLVARQDVRVSQGSVLSAQGQLAGSSDKPLLIGEDAVAAQPGRPGQAGRSGDGALLRVSNAGPAQVRRRNLPTLENSQGVLAIDAGANVDGGASLTLDAARNTLIDSQALLHGRDVQANSGLIVFAGDGAAADLDGFVIGRNTLAGFADAQRIGLRSYGRMEFHGAVDVNVAQELALSAAAFAGDGGDVHLRADRLSLSNELGAAVAAKSGRGGALSLSGREVVFGGGDKSLDGFGRVDVQADQRIAVSGKGGFDFGAAPLSLRAPLIQAEAGADGRLSSQGEISLARGAGAVAADGAQGGAIELSGGRIVGDALIRANAGRIKLNAGGDVRLDGTATLDVSSRGKTLFDQKLSPPAGRIELGSEHGSLSLGANTLLDFSAPSGGDAGGLRAIAGEGAIDLAGALRGGSANGRGGSIELDSAQALALDPLAQRLAASGIDQRIAVRTRSGNLSLSAGHSLKAREVSLIADAGAGVRGSDAGNGHVDIDGDIDASGASGGTIELYGRQGVEVDGRLIATGSDAKRRGGEIRIGVSGVGDGTLNSNYGYQNVQREDSGAIRVGAGAVLDVSGGRAGGLSGGRVDLRAPLLSDGDVRVDIADPASIRGAREVGLEAYAVWSAADAQDPAHPELHFDGIVDPAGWYDAQGTLLPGQWTDAAGNVLAAPQNAQDLAQYLSKHYFAPDAANAAHRGFYGYRDGSPADAPLPGTLMGFVQSPGFAFEQRFAGVSNFRARPGIELRNPDEGINGGAIRVLTNWNLNSGTNQRLDFRYGDSAPVLGLRAAGEIEVAASVSDGFYDFSKLTGGVSGTLDGSNALYRGIVDGQGLTSLDGVFITVPQAPDPGQYSDEQIAQYYGQYDRLMQELSKPDPTFAADSNFCGFACSLLQWVQSVYDFSAGTSPDPALQPPPAPTSPADYDAYLLAYRNYVVAIASNAFYGTGELFAYEAPKLPVPGQLLPRIGPDDRSPNLQASAADPAPFATRTLAGGDSSWLRLVAGADSASAAPTALRARAAAADIRFDGHTTVNRGASGRELLLPNVLRTGTGRIELVAARDIRFDDADAPASVYTAGRPGEGSRTSQEPGQIRPLGEGRPDLVVTGQVNPEAAGDLVVSAGRDILSNRRIFDNEQGSRSGNAGTYLGQFWWPWMQSGNTVADDGRTVLASSINFGGFAQGLLSVGGNVSIQAGRDIRELSVSLPTTWSKEGGGAARSYGGGDLRVNAGRDLLGGDYFLAKGEGELSAGGRIGSAFDFDAAVFFSGSGDFLQLHTPVAPILAMQDARIRVQAAQDVELGRVLNPSYVTTPDGVTGDSQAYGADAELNVFSVAGSIAFDTLDVGDALFSYGLRMNGFAGKPYEVRSRPIFMQALPGRVLATAMDGDIVLNNGGALFPSTRGQLSLLAGGDLLLSADRLPRGQGLSLIDLDPNWMPTPDNQIGKVLGEGNGPLDFTNMVLSNGSERSYRANLHRDDSELVRLYAGGDIVGGRQRDGVSLNPLTIDVPKPASIRAGRDIVDLNFRGQNYRESDLTRIEAGRDLYNNPLRPNAGGAVNTNYSWLQLGGPGTFELQAGRNFGRITSANEAFQNGSLNSDGGGVRTIGNRDNAGLPNEGADIVVRFGVGPGVATDAFAQRYLDPSNSDANQYRDWLLAFVAQLDADRRQRDGAGADAAPMSAEQAWQAFLRQPAEQRQLLVDRVFLDVLERAGKENKEPASPNFGKYSLGYQAINTLFPAAAGYTANRLEGGANGADRLVATGQLDMRGSTIQTQRGGDIRILGPGGDVLVGSVSAPPLVRDSQGAVRIGPNQQGILALEQGDIGIFTDRSVLLAQSRIFTQQGGKMLIWSSNGDINAGKGAKTSSDKPPVAYDCDLDNYCRIDAKGLVTGAGIATLQTVPGGKAADAVLVAPRGTIDAGDAGIRISGNLILAAQTVANADNIQVDGDSVGIPVARGVDGGALAAASSANAGVDAAADAMVQQRPAVATRDIPALISVQVIGFGRCGVDDSRCMNPPPP
ncbi:MULTISPECIES: filamentous haemagglutinin family protein [unclassified Lysobacter]|uniref:filamentous haemagglutinin family protein n=1 Tax=unclassified Lysobacter TaxID=2635362 RepID=UPI001BE98F1C|nr:MULTISPECIES: filamentous haemagglutinin family protein [unclassified Lysobacter]MBT2745383.1 filamentous hemagglutinin family protein [Lysobacter sp. ISL-42]MBT2751980.1 filamentous hemagglutinin family protein [Lysobacter sp. ISL-50]MBT2777945.1 filamentous hemagglutinin family protein [Lysobacter sp. ISL-54]MBT2783201.1 filamentous hemagglutinin family protein [Lysobacter sp. ISL-52]